MFNIKEPPIPPYSSPSELGILSRLQEKAQKGEWGTCRGAHTTTKCQLIKRE